MQDFSSVVRINIQDDQDDILDKPESICRHISERPKIGFVFFFLIENRLMKANVSLCLLQNSNVKPYCNN